VTGFVVSAALLTVVVAAGVAAIAAIRARMRADDDQATWERTLADYKNLRDEGVLSEQEYRNIRTLVEPRTRFGAPAPDGRHPPAIDAAGLEHGRD
jgi:hypothetical protein